MYIRNSKGIFFSYSVHVRSSIMYRMTNSELHRLSIKNLRLMPEKS